MFGNTTSASSSPLPAVFQTYLTQPIPFRRRQSSVSASTSFSQSLSFSPSSVGSPASPVTPASPTSPRSFAFPGLHGHTRNHSRAESKDYDFTGFAGFAAHKRTDSYDSTYSVSTASVDLSRSPTYLSGHQSHISCGKCHADLALTSQIISKGFTGRHGRAYLVAPSSSSLTSAPCTGLVGNQVVSLPNTHTHKAVLRHLVTGMHTVSDISCAVCGLGLGWKYIAAEEESQRYKVGKFILETRRCSIGVCWEQAMDEAAELEADEDAAGGWWGGIDGLDGLPNRRRTDSNARRLSRVASLAAQPAPVTSPRHDDSDYDSEDELGRPIAPKEALQAGMLVTEPDGDDISFDSQDEDECEDLFAGIWSPELARRRRRAREGGEAAGPLGSSLALSLGARFSFGR